MTTPEELSQSLTPDARIDLYELDLVPLGDTDVRRFTASSDVGGSVSFGGNIYTPVNAQADGFEITGQGPLPRPTFRIANIGGLVSALILQFGDIRGMKVTRIRTFRRFLDDGSEPDGTAWLSKEEYIINQRKARNKVFVEYELASVLDQEGRLLPGRQCIKDYCSHRYRVWDPVSETFDFTNATCPYTDLVFFTNKGVLTSQPELDACGKKLSDCRLRFGQNGILPTRAFAGMAQV